MENPPIEHHPLEPFLPANATLLMLGSFPPPRARWSMDFYYPNLQNDMWRIFGLLFFSDKDYFLTGRKFDPQRIGDFCAGRGIALSDTARAVRRLSGNASDKFLDVVEPVDLESLLGRLPRCRAIAATGQKAADTLCAITGAAQPAVGACSGFAYLGRAMQLWRMPSSSRAYPLPLEQKAAVYGRMLRASGLL